MSWFTFNLAVGHAHGVGVHPLIINKFPTFTQIFLLWTESKRKQSQSKILCYISLWCCCLKVRSCSRLARNKEKYLHYSLKFSQAALHFQSQTVQSFSVYIVCSVYNVSNVRLVSQSQSCQTFRFYRFYRSFSFYRSFRLERLVSIIRFVWNVQLLSLV